MNTHTIGTAATVVSIVRKPKAFWSNMLDNARSECGGLKTFF
jgi:hypothetical protein